jgi:hypothetical protein
MIKEALFSTIKPVHDMRSLIAVIVFSLVATIANGQYADSSFLVKNAWPLPSLLSKNIPEISFGQFGKDSLVVVQQGHGKNVNIRFTAADAAEGFAESVVSEITYHFDRNGKLVSETSATDTIEYTYITNKLRSRIAGGPAYRDTLLLHYNNSGLVDEIIRSHSGGVRDEYTRKREQFLYDSKGRMIAYINADYADRFSGTFDYQYDDENKLIRRKFTSGLDGSLACTDSIAYSKMHGDETAYEGQLLARHYFRIGTMGWMLLDQAICDASTKRILMYESFVDRVLSFDQVALGRIDYTYDTLGRILAKRYCDPEMAFCTRREFHYGAGYANDTILFYQVVISKSGRREYLRYRVISSYYSNGLAREIVSETYEDPGKGKKKKNVPAAIFRWKASWA